MYPHIDSQYPNKGDTSTKRLVDCALKRKEEGFNFIKLGLPDGAMRFLETPAKLNELIQKFKSIREAVGDDMELAIDCHGRLSPAMAIQFCKALEPYRPAFVEEPILPKNIDALVKVKESTIIPIATGERLFTKWGFRELLEKQGAAILQPDCCHAGGILEIKKIAAMAEAYYCTVAPHNPLGPISLAACLQVDACIPNFLAQEYLGLDNGWDRGKEYLLKPFEVKGGYIDVPTGHGLGIEVDEQALIEMAYGGNWESPLLFNKDDGSLADW